jgi:hypothetical protein
VRKKHPLNFSINPMKTTSPTNFYSTSEATFAKNQGRLNMIESKKQATVG